MYAILFHAHQKLDRVAHRHLRQLVAVPSFFPSIESIIHFEGANGPDAAKLKKQTDGTQPWHFLDPFDISDTELQHQIAHHHGELVKALKAADEVRAAFEAAWLAHALIDGLTPAHHYPYEKELEDLRGESRTTRKGLVGRGYVKSDTISESMQKSLKLIGPKGLLTNHAMFEAGAWAIMKPLRLTKAKPTAADTRRVNQVGVTELFKQLVAEVAEFDIYERYILEGWTRRLSRDVRRELAPRMVRMVTLAWYSALHEAGLTAAAA